MPPFPDGDYILYCRALSHTGQKLAITFNGDGKYATVEPLGYTENQIWTLKDYNGKTYSVSPKSHNNLQAGWGGEGVEVLPAGGYVWSFTNNGYGFYIQDGGLTKYWFLKIANPGSKISIGDDDGHPSSRWILEKV